MCDVFDLDKKALSKDLENEMLMNEPSIHQRGARLVEAKKWLNELELALKVERLWQSEPPGAELETEVPFSAETLLPEQWLQWVFMPKLSLLIEQSSHLPYFLLTPYFAHCWGDKANHQAVLKILNQLDALSQSENAVSSC